MRGAAFIALAALLAGAGTARAQDTRPPDRTPPPAPPPDAATERAALSPEDAELIKELAVLERLEMLKNLELFEPEKDPPPQSQE